MKYLLFINFVSGLKHNNQYNTLVEICESVQQLIQDEDLDVQKEESPSADSIKEYLRNNDDYFQQFSNGTWYHIQTHPIFA